MHTHGELVLYVRLCCSQVKVCVDVHQSVAAKSKQFLAELSRHNYVTPTSYLELLGTFGKLLRLKMNEISTHRNRTKTGLDKVDDCSDFTLTIMLLIL